MTPEIKARQDIDRRLEQCGLEAGEADYLLYADGKALGVTGT